MKKWLRNVVVCLLACAWSAQADVWMGYMNLYEDVYWPTGQSCNYGVAKLFLDEDRGDSAEITFEVDVYPEGGTVTNVVLWSNIGRRDYAKIYEPFSDGNFPLTSYYMAHEMTYSGSGASTGHELYDVTLTVDECGVFRSTAYFQLDGDDTKYWMNDFEDGGVAHRDLCLVVSPEKVLDLRIYEANTLTVEAGSGGTQSDRSTLEDFTSADADGFDPFNLEYIATNLYFNTLWLMPIHPVTTERWYNSCATAPDACGYVIANYDPGSPYSTRNYWAVNELFSDTGTEAASLAAFSNLCTEAEALGLNVFVDVAMNHAGRDCIFGQGAFDAGLISLGDISTEIRDATPTWCTRGSDWSGGNYYFREPASNGTAAATWAPADQPYRHQWYDAGVDWFYGNYSALGSYGGMYADGIGTYDDERDLFWTWTSPASTYEGQVASNVWNYFAYYIPYWLDQTGNQLDGIRADFAQGLPAQAWEYIINKTRQDKWDFVFLAEVLDDDPVRYRANRHFDLITTVDHYWFRTDAENMSSYRTILEDEASLLTDTGAIMWNGTSHDEDPDGADAWLMWSRYAIAASLYGVPMVYQGQPLGVVEKLNFESAWTNMYPYWTSTTHNNPDRNECYHRVNLARENHPALRALDRYFLNVLGSSSVNEDIYACARWSEEDDEDFPAIPFTTWRDGDIDLVFVRLADASSETYEIPADVPLEEVRSVTNSGVIYQSTPYYQGYNLLSTNIFEEQWPASRTAADIYSSGIGVVFSEEHEAQYIHLNPVECAVEEVATVPMKQLQGLRKTRDIMAWTRTGRLYSTLYALYSGEVASLLQNPDNADLCRMAQKLIARASLYSNLFFNQNKDVLLADADIELGRTFLRLLRNRTKNQSLQYTLDELRARSEKVQGMSFVKALNFLITDPASER